METVCIPRERYEYLIKCERLVDMEFEEKFSDDFIAEVKEREEAYKRGEYIEVKDREDENKRQKHLKRSSHRESVNFKAEDFIPRCSKPYHWRHRG